MFGRTIKFIGFGINMLLLLATLFFWALGYQSRSGIYRVRYLSYLHPNWYLLAGLETTTGELMYRQSFSQCMPVAELQRGGSTEYGELAIDRGERKGVTSVEWQILSETPTHYGNVADKWFGESYWEFGYNVAQYEYRLTIHFRVLALVLTIWPLALVLTWGRRHLIKYRKRQRMAAGLCANCGYDLRHSAGRCPECGQSHQI